ITGNLSDEDTSIELWFRDTAGFTGQKILWETGQVNGQGASLTLDGSTLEWRVRESDVKAGRRGRRAEGVGRVPLDPPAGA
ncbi:MAG: hypothetical protein AAGJ97_16095, partial [Planctomycetota bacterium]